MSITTAHAKEPIRSHTARFSPRLNAEATPFASTQRPEFFRLPKTGGDPYFGLTRPHYYELEKLGKIKLTRLRKPGTTKGVTLVPYAAVLRMLNAAPSGPSRTAKKKELTAV